MLPGSATWTWLVWAGGTNEPQRWEPPRMARGYKRVRWKNLAAPPRHSQRGQARVLRQKPPKFGCFSLVFPASQRCRRGWPPPISPGRYPVVWAIAKLVNASWLLQGIPKRFQRAAAPTVLRSAQLIRESRRGALSPLLWSPLGSGRIKTPNSCRKQRAGHETDRTANAEKQPACQNCHGAVSSEPRRVGS